MDEDKAKILRRIPKVSDFLESGVGKSLSAEFGPGVVKSVLRGVLEDVRGNVLSGGPGRVPDEGALAREVRRRALRAVAPLGRRVVNATGIILHTGLGRAPLCREAVEAVAGLSRYSLLQMDLDSGGRSLREGRIEGMLRDLTGCEAATVVNNNAAAVMITLNTLAEGREVLVSRGQLVEIGGSFRMPEVMARSGAVLREVGTTNRTYLRDYEEAVSDAAAAVMYVHTSNFRIEGFSSTPSVRELSGFARANGLVLAADLGSGALLPMEGLGLGGEPVVSDVLGAGADVVCFSGDKLVGGPQAGLIAGRRDIIEDIRRNPFARMFRVCKMTLAAMEATLALYVNGEALERLPHFRMMSIPVEVLEKRAAELAAALRDIPLVGSAEPEDSAAFLGGGAMPGQSLPSKAVRVKQSGFGAEEFARRLRRHVPSVVGRIKDGDVLFDVRTLLEGDVELMKRAVRDVLESGDEREV